MANTKGRRLQCRAKAKSTGKRCTRWAMFGQKICMVHGGKAPQNLKAAKRRLLEMTEPAIAALDDVINTQQDNEGPSSTVVRAALGVLDRTGLGPTQTIEHGNNEATIPLDALSPKLRKAIERELTAYAKGQTGE